jgi:hypothetical protein
MMTNSRFFKSTATAYSAQRVGRKYWTNEWAPRTRFVSWVTANSFEVRASLRPKWKKLMSRGNGNVVTGHFVAGSASPPNLQLQLTVKSVTPFAEQRSRHFCPQLS